MSSFLVFVPLIDMQEFVQESFNIGLIQFLIVSLECVCLPVSPLDFIIQEERRHPHGENRQGNTGNI
jgi:hypothetical protein